MKVYGGNPEKLYVYSSHEEAVKVAKTARKHWSHDARVVGSTVYMNEAAYKDVTGCPGAPYAMIIARVETVI